MRAIEYETQLLVNIEAVENYLVEGNESEQKEIRDLIRKGKCFVAYKVNDEVRFAPSRFLGYVNNYLGEHDASHIKDGRITNIAIAKVLKSKLDSNEVLEAKYIAYCENLGLQPSNYSKRRYWYLELETDFESNKEIDGVFPEGKIAERLHRFRERNSKVITIAKNNFKLKHGGMHCQVCEFDFEQQYGAIGADFIEGHHTIPVSEMKENHMTSPNEIALLCANCHRMIHKKRPWLSIDELKLLIK